MATCIEMIEGSSIDDLVVAKVTKAALGNERVLVFLDSMHTHDLVVSELEAYAPLVSPGSYCVVFDTLIEDLPPGLYPQRPWEVDNNPKATVGVSSKKAIISKSTAAFQTVWRLALSWTVFSNAFAEPKVVPNSLMYK